MSNVVAISSKTEAAKVLTKYEDVVDQHNIRQTVQNALMKLNAVEERIDKIENKGFLKRMVGGITGSNQKEMVAAMRDISEAQNMTIQLVLSLAIMHAQNQRALEDILDELNHSKGIYTRITDHIEFLYSQVEHVKESQKKEILAKKKMKKLVLFAVAGTAIVIAALITIGMIV